MCVRECVRVCVCGISASEFDRPNSFTDLIVCCVCMYVVSSPVSSLISKHSCLFALISVIRHNYDLCRTSGKLLRNRRLDELPVSHECLNITGCATVFVSKGILICYYFMTGNR